MSGKTGKYLIGDRAFVKPKERSSLKVVEDVLWITADTPLVSVQQASELLLKERGLSLSLYSIREYCNKGKWRDRKGEIWVKFGKQYLLNMDAIYRAIARGD